MLGIEQGFLTEDQWISAMCGPQIFVNLFQFLLNFVCICFYVYFSGWVSSDFQMSFLDLKEVKNS